MRKREDARPRRGGFARQNAATRQNSATLIHKHISLASQHLRHVATQARLACIVAMIPIIVGSAYKSCVMTSACLSVVDNDASKIVRVHVQWQKRFERNSSVKLFDYISSGIELPTLQMQNQALRRSLQYGRLRTLPTGTATGTDIVQRLVPQ